MRFLVDYSGVRPLPQQQQLQTAGSEFFILANQDFMLRLCYTINTKNGEGGQYMCEEQSTRCLCIKVSVRNIECYMSNDVSMGLNLVHVQAKQIRQVYPMRVYIYEILDYLQILMRSRNPTSGKMINDYFI